MELILITNDEELAKYSDAIGINRIMVDLETIGKKERQGHLNTLISDHSLSDVGKIKKIIAKAKLVVRINPINSNSKEEIDAAIDSGADIIMLPMFSTANEVDQFIKMVNGRVIVNLLLETSQAVVRIDDILNVEGIDEIHIGLNDLHLSYKLKFMFEILSGGIIEYLSDKIVSKKIKFGFGGIGRLKQPHPLDAELILSEHYRLNSSMVILSRDFHEVLKNSNDFSRTINLKDEINQIRDYWDSLDLLSENQFEENKKSLRSSVYKIVRH